jgi:hypothetical protein
MAIGAGSFGDPLGADAELTVIATNWNKKLRYIDMNASTGGVARATSITTSWTTLFSYSGSGYIAGWIVNTETLNDWKIRFIIDGEEIFDPNGLLFSDIISDQIYDLDDVTDVNQAFLGLSKGSHDRLVFSSPMNRAIQYKTSVEILLARVSGSKKFQAGLMIMSKET